jgi:hypothetical protein
MSRPCLVLILVAPLVAACAGTPMHTTAGIATTTAIGGTTARLGASTSTAGPGVHVGVGLGRVIR